MTGGNTKGDKGIQNTMVLDIIEVSYRIITKCIGKHNGDSASRWRHDRVKYAFFWEGGWLERERNTE